MSLYKEMYYELFNNVTKAIELLKEAQQKAEDIYINGEEPKVPLTPLNSFMEQEFSPQTKKEEDD